MNVNKRGSIIMSGAEIAEFVQRSRTLTLATIGPGGFPHLTAMWFAVIGEEIWIETKARSQKVVNLRRDSRSSILIDDGLTYDTLRGVSFEGRGIVVEDPAVLWQVGVNIYERYSGTYSEDVRPVVEALVHKRAAVRFEVERVRSWDHRKMGLAEGVPGGSTARYLH